MTTTTRDFQRMFGSLHLEGLDKAHWQAYNALSTLEQREYVEFFAYCTGNTLDEAYRSIRRLEHEAHSRGW